ncbi:MAG: phosphoenolpyruvate--protein phosphotransferase, partial [Gammaproteobacteria bacterium]|nr:phosphoenolpyruvate--protein phosphotransferase [Gammaproteobacteria bacterium]
AIREEIPEETARDIASFIDTHLLMLEDSMLTTTPVQLIRETRCNAEWALRQQRDAVARVFDTMDDAYLRTRIDDIDHVVNRILRILLAGDDPGTEPVTPSLKGQVIVADDLTPADTVLMKNHGVAAFVTEYGGPMSHTTILARSLQIPAVVGTHHARRTLRQGEALIVDGEQGVIVADPDRATLRHYRQRRSGERRRRSELAKISDTPAVTRDGRAICLQANIELPEDLRAVRKMGADGIGLYRTEFLYMNRDEPPSEEEQFVDYRRILRTMQGLPVFIRTLDLGADKQVDGGVASGAVNPALGLRAIRLCLKEPELFRPQLRALLRASAHGPLRIMFPMLSNAQELFQVLGLVEEVKQELADEGLAYDPLVPLGAIVEVPAVAVVAPTFARNLDFLSIGTNDLIQYTLAIDRVDDEVNYLYDPLHPAVLRLIHMTLKAGHKAGIPVAMCGEMAGDPRLTRLLLGLGLTQFSMQPASLLEVKRIVLDTDVGALHRRALAVLRADTHEQMAERVDKLNLDTE